MVKRRKRRGPKHPGVVLIEPTGRRTGWRARYVDPDLINAKTGLPGRLVFETLDAERTTAELREQWAAWKSGELAKRRLALADGAPRATGTTIADAIARYYAAHVRLSERSKVDYKAATSKLVTWAKAADVTSVDELTRARLIAFRETIVNEPKKTAKPKGKRGVRQTTAELRSPETVNGELRKVRTVLGYLRRVDLLPRLTIDELSDALKRITVPTERAQFLKAHDCKRLIEAALRHDADVFTETRAEHSGDGRKRIGTTTKHTPIAPFVAFVLLSGMRRDEARKLDWVNVDLQAVDHAGKHVGEVYLGGRETKTKKARTVDLTVSPALRRLLSALHLADGIQAPTVFALSKGETEAAMKRLREDYGAPPSFTWQLLRSTCATYLTNAASIFGAASAYRSAKQLGHSVTVAERHYLGLVRIPREAETLEAAMQIEDAIERVIAGVATHPRDAFRVA